MTYPVHSACKKEQILLQPYSTCPEIAQVVITEPHAAGPSVSTIDWDLLLHAVEQRLGKISGTLLNGSDRLSQRHTNLAAQAAIADCVDALHKLHDMLVDERQQHRVTQSALRISNALLEQSRADLGEALEQVQLARQPASHDSLTSLPDLGPFSDWVDRALPTGGQAAPP